MLSAMSCSPEVMKRFTPSMCQEPSACRKALVRPAPTSEPASGSVSTIVAPHWWSIMSWAQCFCSSLPRWSRIAAKPGPDMYMKAAGLAPSIISATAQRSDGGAPVPPRCSGRSRRQNPESMSALYDFLNDSGIVTDIDRVVHRRVAVGVDEGLGERALAQRADLSQHLRAVSTSMSA